MFDDTFIDKSGRTRKRKTHCKHGHKFDGTEKWSINWRGYKCRVCRECDKLRMQRKREHPTFKQREREATARWRAADPARAQEVANRAYKKRDDWLRNFKKKCLYCDESRYPCLDFHHRDAEQKVATIGQVRHWGRERLAEEIAKCDVVCANCHRWHHWQENQAKAEQEAS